MATLADFFREAEAIRRDVHESAVACGLRAGTPEYADFMQRQGAPPQATIVDLVRLFKDLREPEPAPQTERSE